MPKAAPIYLDHNAGAPLRAAAREAMIAALAETGNASSVHTHGRAARARLELARETVAQLCNRRARAVTFVSGATEANMTALTPVWQADGAPLYLDRLIRGATEHPSVASGGRFAVKDQTVAAVDSQGRIDLDALAHLLGQGGPALVSIMAANNETGVVQPLAEIGKLVQGHGGVFHVDAVQAAGRMAIDLDEWQADAVSLSAHKIGGPQGIGALVVRSTARVPAPLLTGGGQENWRRAGTENVAAAAGFGAAAEAALAELETTHRLSALRDRLEAGVTAICPDAVVFSGNAHRLPNTLCFAVEGLAAETALIAFDLERVSVSSGSACSSGKVSVSHVLTAMGVDEALARCALRISLGWDSGEAEVERFLEVWPAIVDRLKPEARTRAA
ncbi:cysteine desulfurase [Roseibium aquae]|uniref:Cysteine desulfurase n=1 Tax=Roseibium aquae TaxID=1323746 RepID=A0A916TLF2_9HYPH|nr:cysteine desulfurase family protein [Roseibium aquae]GGB54451.1 cysteine desulfurase [Roseibium aquae]